MTATKLKSIYHRVGILCFALTISHQTSGFSQTTLKQQPAAVYVSDDQVDDLHKARLESLIQTVKAATDNLQPVNPNRLEVAKVELINAIANVQNMFGQLSNETRAGWEDYIGWEGLLKQVNEPKPSNTALTKTIQSLSANQPGIETLEFVALREATKEFKDAAVYANYKNLDALYGSLMKTVTKLINEEIESPSLRNANSIARIAGILEDGRLNPELANALRSAFNQPNFYLSISERLACQLSVSQPTTMNTPVSENILGTKQTGTAKTVGNLLVDFKPNDSLAEIDVILEGVTNSNVVGTQDVPVFGQISVYGEGLTRITGKSTIFVDDLGLSNTTASAVVKNKTTIRGVCTPTIIRQIAKREIHKQSDKGNFIAEKKAKEKIQQGMDDEVHSAVVKANAEFEKNVLAPMVRMDNMPRFMNFSTTENTLELKLLQAGRYQAGAPTAPPKLTRKGDVVLQVHESLLGNVLERILAKQSLASTQLEEIEAKQKAGKPANAESKEEQRPWKITFDSTLPVKIKFVDSRIAATIAIKGIEEAGRPVSKRVLLVSATYDIQREGDKLIMLREGTVNLTFQGKKKMTLGEAAVKGNIEDSLQDLFPPKVDIAEIDLPADGQITGKVRFNRLEVADGWLTAEVELVQ